MDIDTISISSSLNLPTRLDHLHPLLAYTRELANSVGFSNTQQHQLELAVGEIATNIIQHGFENNNQQTFQVNFEITPSKMVVRFFEKGLPFDPTTLPHYSPEQAAFTTEGLGIYLVQKVTDDITFRYLGQHGKEIILTKYLRHQQLLIHDLIAKTPVDIDVTNVNYQIRLFQAKDSIPVARCAYRAYGYSYAATHIYDPAQLIDQNNTGSLISIVATDGNNEEVLGYGDLRIYGEIAEMESIFVAPEYRSTRIFYKIILALTAESISRQLLGQFSLTVTSHLIAQKAGRLRKFMDCGLLLNFMPETNFKSMSIEASHRVSVVVQFGLLKDRMPVTIYVPDNHRTIIEKIYSTLTLPVIIAATTKSPLEFHQSTVYNLEIQSDTNIGILRFSSYGPDAATLIKEQTIHCCRKSIDVIYLYLNAQHPAVSSIVTEAEQIGFFFASVLPGGIDKQDALILQYLNTPVAWDDIKLLTPFAHELLDYIRQESDRIGH